MNNFDTASKFVNTHVVQNVNKLINTLMTQEIYVENLDELNYAYDWNYAVEYFADLNTEYALKEDNGRYDIWNIEDDEIVYQDYHTAIEAVQDFYYDDNGDFSDIQVEPLEFWIVSDWLFDRLGEQYEPVAEILGLKIWGRTCSGQAIALDENIQEIAIDVAQNKPWLL